MLHTVMPLGSPSHRLRFPFTGAHVVLLLDLLEESESGDRAKVFDIGLLAERLQSAGNWLAEQPRTKDLPLGYFGASTGAAAALVAAVNSPTLVKAVVSRGGRPDLASHFLLSVRAPTLLIVGDADIVTPEHAVEMFRAIPNSQLCVVPNAGHGVMPDETVLKFLQDDAAVNTT